MIDEIIVKTNVDMLNTHHERVYFNKKGIMLIKYNNDNTHILDLESSTDITNADYIKIIENKKTKTEIIFKNIMFDKKLLKKLAGDIVE